MKFILTTIILYTILIANATQLPAQIHLTHPTTRAVYQRNQNNEATLYLAGNYEQRTTKIEARAIARTMNVNQGTTTPWTVIQTHPKGGIFYGSLLVQGGWYDIQIRAWNDTTLVGKDSIQRIGVGEVFVIAGQSNACGVEDIRLQGNTGPSANDDRVSVVNYINWWDTGYNDVTLPLAVFQHAEANSRIAPFGISAWCWGAVGDLLTQRLNVPVAFFNAARSSTSIETWSSTANDSNYSPPYFIGLPPGMPYGNLRLALNFYAAQFGVRAVLWHQGESDNITSTEREDYANKLHNVIEKSRLHANKPDLTWIVSRATRFKGLGLIESRTWQPVIDAQNDVIGINGNRPGYTYNVVPGPETDSYIGPDVRDNDDVHFQGNGHYVLANLWNTVLNDDFLKNHPPYEALPLPQITSTCITENTVTYKTPTTFTESIWTNYNEANNNLFNDYSYTASLGSFRARLRDQYGNVLITSKVSVPRNFNEIFPVESVQSGDWGLANTWSCGKIPTVLDNITINQDHVITVPTNAEINYHSLLLLGRISLLSASKLIGE